ncbi:hypothetical protein Y887_05345 [Xanthomonas pisi DSM 18956]|uniref:Uncharacterized protein n=2 Tax=Xanthomonas pisi TaxID=56457 RepID=A0A2S7D2Y5_9XANT|nr:hypothetical protein Y887_05345 [Xanthomonas pisi DSM 18956]PPU68203.1 hypothetical protein XpiCFBP4643_11300 [Xanthomonas pisi]
MQSVSLQSAHSLLLAWSTDSAMTAALSRMASKSTSVAGLEFLSIGTGGAILGINRPDRDPPLHHESWINTGQWLRFDHVPATRRSRFVAEVRVHPEWPRDRATEVEFRVLALAPGKPPLQATLTPSLEKQTEWTRIELDLAPLAGDNVKIQLVPSAQQGIWTLMRDPKVVVAEVAAQ